jgi:RecA/RadA recombinase
MSLLDKIRKQSTIKTASVLSNSVFFADKSMTPTSVPMLNVALSGSLDGGLTSGLTMIAGPSRHFKTAFGLLMVSAYLKQKPDSVCLFYDSEFGATPTYFEAFDINPEQVLHLPVKNIEELKFDIVQQLENLTRDDNVIVFIDSIGNLASKKEVDDAISGNSAADMTRAKSLKSLFRMVTPYLTMNDIPMVAINHSYQTLEMFSKAQVSGGTGGIYSADTIFIVGRQQEKDGKDIAGYNFVINIEKSRYVKEKAKIPITVKYDSGISKWSGLLDFAVDEGLVVKPKNGWYARTTDDGVVEDKNWRAAQTESAEFWKPYLESGRLQKAVSKKYALGTVKMIGTEVVDTTEENKDE